MNNVCVTSCYELEMLDGHTASLFNLNLQRNTPNPPPPPPLQIHPNNNNILSFHIL